MCMHDCGGIRLMSGVILNRATSASYFAQKILPFHLPGLELRRAALLACGACPVTTEPSPLTSNSILCL